MKTTDELNEKWWYRLLKVLYIGLSLICYSVAITIIVVFYLTINQNKENFISTQNLNNEKLQLIEEMKSKNYTTLEIGDALKKKYQNPYEPLKLTRVQMKAIYGEKALEDLDLPERDKSEPEMPGTFLWLLLVVPVALSIAWFILQLVRWIFYYIVLGSIKPNKT